ncbi:hypothetical protein [Roseibium sp.]|uniref:hypothetical protein n=1 Tax=Roseibium sp. TaxID=1936156 RepID=UPI003B520125
MAITIKLTNDTGMSAGNGTVWVAGWINAGASSSFKTLQKGGSFAAPANPSELPFHSLPDVATVTLDESTNGNDRLLFVVAQNQPEALAISNNAPTQYAQYPYAAEPGDGVQPAGPYDVFEFGMDAQFNVTAVSGFGLNLRFSATNPATGHLQYYGIDASVSREQIGAAFTAFVANEAKTYAPAADFAELLYSAPLPGTTYMPPMIGNEFFALCDPNDMLAAKSGNYTGSTSDPLASYWDTVLGQFFAEGNRISLNLSANPAAPEIYSGICGPKTNPETGYATQAYSLSNGTNSYDIYKPKPGLQSAQYVFQQAFGNLTPAGSAGDAGLLQDAIWEALCRGVAMSGVLLPTTPLELEPGFSTLAWNNAASWYRAGSTCHYYAKFLHCSDIDGNDCRISGKSPIYYGGAAYGFSMDEDPLGPYSGPNVPSKTPFYVSSGTIKLSIGPWLGTTQASFAPSAAVR